VVVVSDGNTADYYLERTLAGLNAAGYAASPVVIPSGEAFKTLETVAGLWEAFLKAGVERGSTIVALGGGVTGDLTGFAASVYLRGVRWVGIPTTLLAMVDSALGGKTGADLPQGKNLIGAFHPPALVLADPKVLATLPDGEFRSGLGEVVKHGVIADPDLFALCEAGLEAVNTNRTELVRRAMAVKVRVIQEDPYENGRRASLNLGHTIGHAIELVSGFRLRHGEAVAIGMVVEARLAERLGLARPGLAERIALTLAGLGLPTKVPSDLERGKILLTTSVDKKRSGGRTKYALPCEIGDVRVGVTVEDALILSEL
jgi:3-dehydroquinate synthase